MTGRNDSCPCGSGRKFKHCHGSLPATAETVTVAATTAATARRPDPEAIGMLVELVEQGRLGEAETRVRSALLRQPNIGILWKILSVALLRQDKDALHALRRAAELLPNDAEALRNLGTALHDRGEWSAALETLRQALAIEPDNADALVESADSMRGLGRIREAVPLYQRALTLDPSLVEARNNLGNAFLELQQYADAVSCYQLALGLKPRHAQILCNLSNAQRQLGKLDEAADTGAQAIAVDPSSGIAHNNFGLALAALGRRDEAVASFRQALQLDPSYVDALSNLGSVLRDLGDRHGAVSAYRQAIPLAVGRPECYWNLGNVLFELRQIDAALESFRAALALKNDCAPAHLGIAFVKRQQRRPAEAEASCLAALSIDPKYVEALHLLGELRADRGQFAEADRLFQQVMELKPDFSFALASMATHRKMTVQDTKWLRTAQALLARQLPLGQEISLRYALGKFFDDVRQYDEAFTQYHQGNELTKRYGSSYNRAGLEQRIDNIISSFPVGHPRGSPEGTSASELPILIVGMPRSGTSLAEQILASHPAIFGGGEVAYWNAAYDAYRERERKGKAGLDLAPGMGTDYLAQLAAVCGDASRVVDKMPANFMYVGLIHAALPNARIIHMQRHPIDTCLSIYFQNFLNIGPYANDLDDLAHYYEQYVRITRHWRTTLPASSLLEVPYEALIDDQETWTRRMLEFVGVPWDARCLSFQDTARAVITASKWQVRQKINSASTGRWRNYEKYIEPLRRLC